MSNLEKLHGIKEEVERRKSSKCSFDYDPRSVLMLVAETLILIAEQNEEKIELLKIIKSNTSD
jgi:hypothetical protein